MERILKEEEEEALGSKRRRRAVVYLGDGNGDYCPSLKVGQGDYVMPRTGYPVWNLLVAPGCPVRGAVRSWDGFEDLAGVLLDIVHAEIARAAKDEDVAAGAMNTDRVAAVPVPVAECRGAGMPLHQDALHRPKALRVPN